MEHLLTAWKEKIVPLLTGRFLLICLDYDGTLTPIVEHPSLAKLSSEGRKILEDLAGINEVKVAVVSGRSLSELKELIKVPGLVYVGNHGLEFEGPKIQHVHPAALDSQKLLAEISHELEEALVAIKDIFVENKMFTLSVHYRQVAEEDIDRAKQIFNQVVEKYLQRRAVVLTEGKKVWEVRPAITWNKGDIVLWLFARVLTHFPQAWPLYVGDDQTDEDAFKALRGKGLGVKVSEDGNEPSEASYYLRSTEEVFEFLKRLKVLNRTESSNHVSR